MPLVGFSSGRQENIPDTFFTFPDPVVPLSLTA
jgi:hypothetical protein